MKGVSNHTPLQNVQQTATGQPTAAAQASFTAATPAVPSQPAVNGTLLAPGQQTVAQLFGAPGYYAQHTDPTLQPFLSQGETLIGQRAHTKQLNGQTPGPDEVRVPAKNSGLTVGGDGLHEVLPTSNRGDVAKAPLGVVRDTLADIQSGMRTAPSKTFFRRDDNGAPEVGGHTGAFRGNQGTTGQAAAHNQQRHQLSNILVPSAAPPSDGQMVAQMMSRHLNATASGPEIMASHYFTGMSPNMILNNPHGERHGTHGADDFRRPLESPGAANPYNRIELASLVHADREVAKERLEQYIQTIPVPDRGEIVPPSPRRATLNADGTGGQFETNAALWVQAPPTFPPQHEAAHESAWLTQPLRHTPVDASPAPTATATIASQNQQHDDSLPNSPIHKKPKVGSYDGS
ncbi:hypothetical protein [Chitinivorax sp. B]|uniref:hypothetical protein n=1 Tax=Chitinivorax sp. B TaxID=2502235 RepID=UPI0010F7CFE8|nr:hypothetical protein [Chitinivorax sp. B]